MKLRNLTTLLFAFIMCALNLSAQTWNATWIQDNSNTLKITNENANNFHFEFVVNGVKDLEGDAINKGTSAIYSKNKLVLNFDLASDTSYIKVWYINNKGKTISNIYKMPYDEFFKRLNKQGVAEPSTKTEASAEKSNVNESNSNNTTIDNDWSGTWKLSKNYTLNISKVSKNNFHFAFDCFNGTNLGQAEGDAVIKGSKATYKNEDKSADFCPINFELGGNLLKVEVLTEQNPDCFYDAGNGVFYDGIYKKTESKSKISKGKNRDISTSSDFESFWKEFKTAVLKGDKNKVAEMTNFPIQGDPDLVFSDDNGKTYPNNKEGFVKIAFDKIFNSYTIKQIKKITNIKSGKIEKNISYKFTSFQDLAKDSRLPEFLTNTGEGFEFKIFTTKSAEGEFMDFYYFVKVNGVYMLYGKQFAG